MFGLRRIVDRKTSAKAISSRHGSYVHLKEMMLNM
jgi:hypothetical protein